MITIKVDKLPFKLPNNQIIYIEREYNEFFNSCFSNIDAFQALFSHYYRSLNNYYFYGEECNFIYVPKLIKEWSKESNEILEASLIYNYPSLHINSTEIANSLSIDTISYTNFFLKLFDNSISEQIQSGLLIYNDYSQEFIYFPLTAKDVDSLIKEIRTFFHRLSLICENYPIENFSFSTEYREDVPDDEKSDYDFSLEGNMIANEIRERIELLKGLGHEEVLLRLILEEISKIDKDSHLKALVNDIIFYTDFYVPEKKVNRLELFKKNYLTKELSTISIDQDYRIFLPEYKNLEIKMTPLPKAVYFLFLRHPEGIMFKNISRYRQELHCIYNDISNRENIDGIGKSIDDICNPAENSINEKCSRIKEAFLSQFEDDIAKNYYITGRRGCPKLISLDRVLVKWDTSFYYDNLDYDAFGESYEDF